MLERTLCKELLGNKEKQTKTTERKEICIQRGMRQRKRSVRTDTDVAEFDILSR